jgi:hypothetical protein
LFAFLDTVDARQVEHRAFHPADVLILQTIMESVRCGEAKEPLEPVAELLVLRVGARCAYQAA